MIITTRLIFLAFIVPANLETLKLNLSNGTQTYKQALRETLYPLLESLRSVSICTVEDPYNLLNFILIQCHNQKIATSIDTSLKSFSNDIKCFIVLNSIEVDICELFLNSKETLPNRYLTVIFVNLELTNLTEIENCTSDLYFVKFVSVSLKTKEIIIKQQHFSKPISSISQNLKDIYQTNSEFLTYNFHGKLINVATFHNPPFSIMRRINNSSVKYSGMEMNLFKEMSIYMNFTWRVVDLPSPGNWGSKLSNGTVAGGIPQALREGLADIGFCNVWQHEFNMKSMDFGPPMNRIYLSFIVKRPYQLTDRWQNLIGIFKKDVWMATIIALLMFSVVFWIIHNHTFTTSKQSLIASALTMFGMLTMATSYQRATKLQLRLVIVCWFLFTLLFTTALTSSIASRLSVPYYSPRVDLVKQLVEGGFYWTQPSYIGREATLNDIYFDMNNTWQRQFQGKYKYVKPQDVKELLKSDDRIAVFAQRLDGWVLLQIDGFNEDQNVDALTNFRLMRTSTREAYASFVFRKHSPFNKPFSRTIQRFIDHGLWAYWVYKLTRESSRKQLLVERDFKEFTQPEQLTLTKLFAVFYLLVIGLSLSLLVFLIEVLIE